MTSDPGAAVYLEAANISKHFGGVQALDNVSLTVRHGEIRALIGENGCGKSTFIKILAGVHERDSGTIVIGGRHVGRLRPIDAMRAGIQVIYQDFALFPNLSVAENIALSALIRGRSWLVHRRAIHRLAARALDQLTITIDVRRLVSELSVADKQLVAIARALLHDARLLIMDEPTTALTGKEVQRLFTVVRELKQKGMSTLFVSHKLGEVLDISDQLTVLRNGRKVADGPVQQFDRNRLTECMTGEKFECHPPPPPVTRAPTPRLQVRALTRPPVHDITFDVYPGEIVGLAGLLGSGRTDLALTLFGVRPAQSGTLLLDGVPVSIRRVGEATRLGLAYVPEDRLTEGLFLAQSVQTNVVAATLPLLCTPRGLLDRSKVAASARQWIENLAIKTTSVSRPVHTLSGGNQQKVVLAKWLARQPRVMILNRPTVGVDVGAKAEIHDRIRRLIDDQMALLLISDDLPELAELCHRILLMHRGRLIEELGPQQCTEEILLGKLNQLK